MLIINYVKINEDVTINKLLALKQFISSERVNNIKRFKFEEDKIRSILGELLVRYTICKNSNIENSDIYFKKNEFGKPYIDCNYGIYFNLSHSGSYLICAISNQNIGIDIEKIQDIDIAIAHNFFCDSEYDEIASAPESKKYECFYSYWCLKESYIKYIGKGLTIPLNSFCFEMVDKNIKVIQSNEEKKEKFALLSISNNYKAAVCYLAAEIETISEIALDDIITYFIPH
ncbi:4'-phosphopantetheinyl transferase superfamily protein [Bacillus sp. FJAT-53711]|uniref:4'-phosphopantetheinyl transferase superfamily protein n=1 Tax=Bacillus yunxiaonensis TaxID=3127665 RepID=A0ABU8FY26_9BACI